MHWTEANMIQLWDIGVTIEVEGYKGDTVHDPTSSLWAIMGWDIVNLARVFGIEPPEAIPDVRPGRWERPEYMEIGLYRGEGSSWKCAALSVSIQDGILYWRETWENEGKLYIHTYSYNGKFVVSYPSEAHSSLEQED